MTSRNGTFKLNMKEKIPQSKTSQTLSRHAKEVTGALCPVHIRKEEAELWGIYRRGQLSAGGFFIMIFGEQIPRLSPYFVNNLSFLSLLFWGFLFVWHYSQKCDGQILSREESCRGYCSFKAIQGLSSSYNTNFLFPVNDRSTFFSWR